MKKPAGTNLTVSPFQNKRNLKTLYVLSLLAAACLSFFYNLGDVPLFDRDEGAFSEATREMFSRGDFISTYLDGEPRYDKPILFYWFQAASVAAWGLNEFALRLPSAVFATLWVLSIFFFCAKRLETDTAWAAALIGATCLGTVAVGRWAIADALLNLLIALSLFEIYRCYQRRDKAPLYRAFVWMALGFLTKGPIAVAIPVMASFVFFAIKKRWKQWLRNATNPIGILLFLLINLPWYGIQTAKEGMPFIRGFFMEHNVGRYMSPMEGHGGAFIYYVPVAVLIVMPYTTLFVKSLARLRRAADDDMDLFLWTWFFTVFAFFSLSGTKLPHYLMYGSTPLFILMARHRSRLRLRWLALLPPLLFAVGVCLAPLSLHSKWLALQDGEAAALIEHARSAFAGRYYLVAAGVLALTGALLFFRRMPVWGALIVAGLLHVFLAVQLVLPTLGHIIQSPVKEAALFSRAYDEPVVRWGLNTPSVGVYREAVTPRRWPQNNELVITKTSRLERLEGYELLFQKGPVVLVRVLADKRPRGEGRRQ